MKEKLISFKVMDIASWNLKGEQGQIASYKVFLPDIQRGFVWRADRIEDLWDSIFRGFPIGSFLVSETKASEFQLLDGQQRATSIEIGLSNPWFKETFPKSILWLDISREKSGAYKYQFKLINTSNPWGVDSRKKTLDSENRKSAIVEFKRNKVNASCNKYYDFDLKHCWPWESTLPIPLCFFSEAVLHTDDLKTQKNYLGQIIAKRLGHITKTKTKDKKYRESIEEFLTSSDLDLLLKKVSSLLNSEIPAIVLDNALINHHDASLDDECSLDWSDDLINPVIPEEEAEKKDVIELIFERVNSKGFPLEGDELIYSIFKSQCHEATFIPERCDYIKPSRLVNFCIKIIMAQSKDGRNTIPGKIKIYDFKKWVTTDGNLKNLEALLETLKTNDSIFNKAKEIFYGSYPFQFSYYQLLDFVENYPDAFWVLLYRLHNGDKIELGSEFHKKVLGFLTTLGWFGKMANRKTLPAIREIWKEMRKDEAEVFWSSETIRKAVLYNKRDEFVLLPMPSPEHLSKIFSLILDSKENWYDLDFEDLELDKRSPFVRFFSSYFEKETPKSDSEFDDPRSRYIYAIIKFVQQIRDAEGLLAYSSRDIIKKWFDDFYLNRVEGADQPWDRDHIFATKLLSRRGVSEVHVLKSWQNTIGNIRYWPIELNRGAGAASPLLKLNFDFNSVTDKQEFECFGIKSVDDILIFSLISEEWLEIGEDEQSKKEYKKTSELVTRLVIERILRFYTEWYNNLNIAGLFPQSK